MKTQLIAGVVAGVFLLVAAVVFGPEEAKELFGTLAEFVTEGGME
jgi:Sec-independent protein translocase protein TatA